MTIEEFAKYKRQYRNALENGNAKDRTKARKQYIEARKKLRSDHTPDPYALMGV